MLRSGLRLRGERTLELYRDGQLIHKSTSHNLVVRSGERYAAQAILPNAPTKKIQFMQLGRGGTTPVSGDAALKTVIAGTRAACDTASPSGRTAIFVHRWTAGEFSATGIREVGLFSQLTNGAGTMFARSVFTARAKNLADTFKITWKVSLADDGV
jgi:hypothetical protein